MSLSPSAIPLQQADLEESGAVVSAELVSGVLDDCIDSNNSRLSPESLSASGKFLAATSSVGDHEEISLEMALPFLIGSGFSEAECKSILTEIGLSEEACSAMLEDVQPAHTEQWVSAVSGLVQDNDPNVSWASVAASLDVSGDSARNASNCGSEACRPLTCSSQHILQDDQDFRLSRGDVDDISAELLLLEREKEMLLSEVDDLKCQKNKLQLQKRLGAQALQKACVAREEAEERAQDAESKARNAMAALAALRESVSAHRGGGRESEPPARYAMDDHMLKAGNSAEVTVEVGGGSEDYQLAGFARHSVAIVLELEEARKALEESERNCDMLRQGAAARNSHFIAQIQAKDLEILALQAEARRCAAAWEEEKHALTNDCDRMVAIQQARAQALEKQLADAVRRLPALNSQPQARRESCGQVVEPLLCSQCKQVQEAVQARTALQQIDGGGVGKSRSGGLQAFNPPRSQDSEDWPRETPAMPTSPRAVVTRSESLRSPSDAPSPLQVMWESLTARGEPGGGEELVV